MIFYPMHSVNAMCMMAKQLRAKLFALNKFEERFKN